MEIRDLKYLAAAASTSNFGRAAKSLGVDTSTISRHIARLEDELGLALFERANTGVHLTPGGKAVMVHVNRTLAEFDAVGRSARQNGTGHAGEIRLGVRMPPVGEPLGSLLAGWRVRHPNVVLTIVEMNEPSMAMALEHRRLDVGIVTSFTPCANSEALPLYRERLTAALPVDHALAERDSVEWDDLQSVDARIVRVPPRAKCAIPSASGEQAECLRPGRRRFWSDAGDGEPGGGHRTGGRVPADRRDKCVGSN
jgi:DNA-binding transcriptional LysR family regulator